MYMYHLCGRDDAEAESVLVADGHRRLAVVGLDCQAVRPGCQAQANQRVDLYIYM